MKLIYSLVLLLVMGCASKPTDSKYYDSAYGKKLDLQIENLNCPIGAALQYDIISGRFGCEQIETFHATAAQWEAAQGLYNPHHVKGFMVSGPWTSGTVVTCTGCTITSTATGTMVMSSTGSTKSPCDETFPPSGDAK